MTQNNEREALLDKLLAEYWDIAYSEGNSGLWHGKKAQSTLNDIRKLFKTQSPISQNEQQEEWISVDIRLPSAMQEVLLTNSDGYFVHGKPIFHNSTGEFNCWIYTLYSQDVLDFITQYRPTHWMPLPPAPTTSETNTEVGE